jgi:hypothetical protein
MSGVYEAELERHLRRLTSEEAELITAALQRVTGSTCEGGSEDAEGAAAATASA